MAAVTSYENTQKPDCKLKEKKKSACFIEHKRRNQLTSHIKMEILNGVLHTANGKMKNEHIVSVQFFIVLHHLHHVTSDTLQYIRTIIIPNKRTLHNDKKRKMCAVTKVA